MALKIAVQMDPIERINIAGDSTFALLLAAWGAFVLLRRRANTGSEL